MSSKRILLCEDYALTREILVTGLKKTGHQVIDFESADQALKLTPDAITTIDVLLTDVEMPGTNGIELAWRLRRVSPELCVVVMSGSFIPYDQISNLDAIFLPKPFAFNDLIGAIEACPTARRENPLHQLA